MEIKWKTCFRVGLSIFVLYLCITYWSVAFGLLTTLLSAAAPLFIGCVVAYIINILMSFYEKFYFTKSKNVKVIKSRRPVCMVLAFITLLAIIALVIGLVVPELVSCVQLIFNKLPDAMNMVVAWLEDIQFVPEDILASIQAIDLESRLEQIVNALVSGVGNVMGTVVSTVASVFSGIVTALLSFIFAIYLLSGKEKLANQFERVMKRYMKKSGYSKVKHVFSVMNDCFHRYIVGQCTEAVILGLLCALGMFILRLPYATMIGALIAFTALIPVAGAYIGAGVGAFMIMTVSPIQALVFLIYIVVLQQVEGNVIYPRVVGSSMGLPAIWVLAAVTVGGGMMGIAGMLIGVPLAATAYRLLKEDVNKTAVKPMKKVEE
ncbi:MAG: AI-2E family transporter [Lachnospiraceae bacterium]|nr:AI-2E family transporter [Lachnospiraceae bacterium]